MPTGHERYAAYQSPLEGVATSIEDSRFYNPVTAQVADFIVGYSSPAINSKRKQAAYGQFIDYLAKDGKRQLEFHSYLDELITSAATYENESVRNQRLEQYKDLKAKIEKYFPLFADKSHPFPDIPLPEASRIKMPREAIQLTNEALQSAYPNQKALFYELQPQHVRVASRMSLHAFENAYREQIRNTAVGRKINELFGVSDKSQQAVDPTIWRSFPGLPGRPIVVSETQFKDLDIMVPEQLSAALIHEDLHRIARPMTLPAREHPELVNLAFSVEYFKLRSMNTAQRDKHITFIDFLKAFAQTHSSYITIEGADTILTTEDGGNIMLIARSGYDINEAIIERLAKRPREIVLEKVKKKYPERWYQGLKQRQEEDQGVMGSYVLKNPYSQIDNLMADLGLHTEEELLEAYTFGRIPFLWLEHRPLAHQDVHVDFT